MKTKESERALEDLISFSERASKCENVLHKLSNLESINKLRGIFWLSDEETIKVKIPSEYEKELKRVVEGFFKQKLKFLNDKKKELKERLDKKLLKENND